MWMNDELGIVLKDLAEELYFRANDARYPEERAALKGMQHCIEKVLNKHHYPTFNRPDDDK